MRQILFGGGKRYFILREVPRGRGEREKLHNDFQTDLPGPFTREKGFCREYHVLEDRERERQRPGDSKGGREKGLRRYWSAWEWERGRGMPRRTARD